jgi:hypothetical protein
VLCAAYKNDRGFIRRKGLNTGHPNWLAVFWALYVQGEALFRIGIAIGVAQPQFVCNFLSDRQPALVGRFENYLRDTATSLNATVIAEENSKQLVDQIECQPPPRIDSGPCWQASRAPVL